MPRILVKKYCLAVDARDDPSEPEEVVVCHSEEEAAAVAARMNPPSLGWLNGYVAVRLERED